MRKVTRVIASGVVILALLGADSDCKTEGGISGDTARSEAPRNRHVVKLRASGSSPSKQVKVDWQGDIPGFNHSVGRIWTRSYYAKSGMKVDFRVTNRVGTGNVVCTIYVDEIPEVGPLRGSHSVTCSHRVS